MDSVKLTTIFWLANEKGPHDVSITDDERSRAVFKPWRCWWDFSGPVPQMIHVDLRTADNRTLREVARDHPDVSLAWQAQQELYYRLWK